MKVIVKDTEFIRELESLQYEVQARKNIIIYILESNSVNSNIFDNYHKEYVNYFKAYEKKKQDLEQKFVYPNCAKAKNWSLDFATGELTID